MLSMILIYFANILSRTAGRVYSTSIKSTGRPFVIALFMTWRKLLSVNFTTFLGFCE